MYSSECCQIKYVINIRNWIFFIGIIGYIQHLRTWRWFWYSINGFLGGLWLCSRLSWISFPTRTYVHILSGKPRLFLGFIFNRVSRKEIPSNDWMNLSENDKLGSICLLHKAQNNITNWIFEYISVYLYIIYVCNLFNFKVK